MLPSLLLAASLSTAIDTPTIPYASKYDAAFAEARVRNVPVLIIDFDGWTEDKQQTQPEAFYSDKDFLTQIDGAVVLLASQEDHGSVKATIDGTDRDVCKLFGGVHCTTHRDVLPKLFTDFGKDGQLISPLFVVASPDKKELVRFEHEELPRDLVLALKGASKLLGPGMSRTVHRQLQSGLERVRRLVELREYAAATASLEPLQKIPGTFALNADVKIAASGIEEAGRAQTNRAKELWEAGRRLDGMIMLDDVKASFGRLPSAVEASATIRLWEKDAAAKAFMAGLQAHRGARQIYQQAVAQDAAGDRKRAGETLEKLLRQFPDSQFTNRAKILRDAVKGR
ncbi:MAG: hypothetical protein EXS13_12910 [Planctomycetes bacterium]|nr:hypothetical protein [Planctomycetota bacterium]